MRSWLSRLIGGKTEPPGGTHQPIYEATASESTNRAEAAIPGTGVLPPLVTLAAPPVTLPIEAGNVGERDYGPDPVAECSVACLADAPFEVGLLREALESGLKDVDLRPTFYFEAPEGRTFFLSSAGAQSRGKSLIAAWDLGRARVGVDTVRAGIASLRTCLDAMPCSFAIPELDTDALAVQIAKADAIKNITPENVEIIATLPGDEAMDGKQVWNTLHRTGFRWGDMDCFQWPDPTRQTDHLIWVEVDDQHLGYALPEEIAAGRQHFHSIRWILDVARSPAPRHVLEEMIRAAEAFAEETRTILTPLVDGEAVETPDQLREAVSEVVAALEELGVAPGSSSVCQLR